MDLLNDKIKPIYFKYLFAAVGSALVASVFGFIDAAMVGNYHGPIGTAALAVFNPCWTIVFSLGILAGMGSATIFANYRGQGNEERASEYFTLAIIFGAVLSIVSFLVLTIFTDPIFRFFGANDELLGLAKKYFTPVKFAIPMCVFDNILSSFLRNDGNPGLAMKGVIIGGVFNAIGDYVFVFVLNMGIFGAGLATSIGLTISTLIMCTHFLSKKNTLHFVRPRRALRKIFEICGIGFACAITDLAMGIIGILFNKQIMLYHGTNALAVYGVITQVVAFVQCSTYGIGQAAQPIISQNYGAKQYSRVITCLNYAIICAIVVGVFWIALLESVPTVFVNFFMTPTDEVLQIAPGIIRAYSLSFLILPFNIFAPYYFQSLLRPGVSMASSILRSIVISSITILFLPLIFGKDSLWFAMLVTEILVLIFNLTYTIIMTKKLTKLSHEI